MNCTIARNRQEEEEKGRGGEGGEEESVGWQGEYGGRKAISTPSKEYAELRRGRGVGGEKARSKMKI